MLLKRRELKIAAATCVRVIGKEVLESYT